MSSNIEYLLQLHRNGVITDDDLRKGIRALKLSDEPSSKQEAKSSEPKESPLEKLRTKRREKKRRRKQRRDLARATAVHEETQELADTAEASQNLKLVDKPLCNYFKTYEINAKKYKDPSILFENKKSLMIDQINKDIKEYKGIKFSVGLSLEFFKDEKDGTRKYFQGQKHGEQSAVLQEHNVEDLYNEQVAHIEKWIENFTSQEGTGAAVNKCIKLYLNIAKYEPLKGSSYMPLPDKIANKKAVINVKNDDNRCIDWALKSALYPAKNNVSNKYTYTKYDLNLEGIVDFPTPVSQISKVEKHLDLAINVYGYTVSKKLEKLNIFPYHISEKPKEKERINLLLISEDVECVNDKNEKIIETKSHYCWIKNLNRLLHDQNSKHGGKTYFCDHCLYGFTKEDLLIKHKEDCYGINKNSTKIQMPTEGKSHIKFKNYQNQMSVPYVIYADFESIIKPQTEKAGEKSEITSEQEVCGFGYQVVRHDNVAYPPVIYRGKDAIEVFLKKLQDERHVINNKFKNPEPLTMTEQDKEDYLKATHCWICEQEIINIKANPKVKDHCHFTGKYRGAAHKICNLKLKIKPYKTPIPVVFHNLRGYDSHFIMQKAHKTYGNITCIPNNAEKYISFQIGQLKFLDSFMFMSSSLSKLVENTPDLKITREAFTDAPLNKETYKVGKFDSEDNRDITLREIIDKPKLEYIIANHRDFDLGSCFVNGAKVNKDSQLVLLKECLSRTNKKGESLMRYHQRNEFGRYWTSEKMGLQSMSRKIRHTICKDNMIDIDMKNAHPTLLASYCHQNGILCEGLDTYVNDRENLLARYMKSENLTRDEAKKNLLANLNGREVTLKDTDPDWFVDYYNGMRSVIDKVCELNPDLYELASKQKLERRTTYNIKGSAVNLLMCKLENKALMAAFDYLNENGVEICALVFDGLMVYKDTVKDIEEILKGCSRSVKKAINCYIVFTVKDMDEGYDITTASQTGNQNFELLKKGVYPYEYFDSFEKFNETQLPPIEQFFSSLTDETISQKDYEYAQKIWKEFNCKTLGDYHDLYLKSDVTLLADVFQTFRKTCMEAYKLDPLHYYTAPGLSWDALLKYTKIDLELLTDMDMYLFIEKGMRGGISMVSKRHAKANNPYTTDYDSKITNNYIMYYDANNLYGWAMKQPLPYSGFKWYDMTDKSKFKKPKDKGWILEVDLEYPKELHDLHNDYPLAPEKLTVQKEWLSDYQTELIGDENMVNVSKLVPNLMNKKKYVVHYRNLTLYMQLGMKVTKVHRILEFNEKPWMEPYIRLNTEFRKKAKSAFEKDFYKLMNNSVFGKTMENLRKRVDIKLVKTDGSENGKLRKIIAKPNLNRRIKFSDELSAIHVNKTSLTLNKPIYVGFSVLDLSKHLMYDWYYNKLKKKYGKKVQVGKDQEKAQSEKDSHSKNRGGKKPNQQSGTYTMKQS